MQIALTNCNAKCIIRSVWCIQCKTDKPDDQFLPIRKRGYRVVKCNTCASENVRRWWRNVNMNPDAVGDVDD